MTHNLCVGVTSPVRTHRKFAFGANVLQIRAVVKKRFLDEMHSL